MQLVLVNNRIVAHGEGFLAMGGVVINPETGAKHDNATITEHEGGCPSDIDVVGYEYHAGRFVPCAPYGKTNSGSVMVACEECGTPRRSGVSIENGTIIPESADGNNVFEKERVIDDVTHKAAVSVGDEGATLLKHYQRGVLSGLIEVDSDGAYWRQNAAGERRSLMTDLVSGSYTGDDESGRLIELGFTPSFLMINGSMILPGLPAGNGDRIGAEIVENGFRVYNHEAYSTVGELKYNAFHSLYRYMAVRR